MTSDYESIDRLIALGNAATGNQGFTNLLIKRLAETGKPVDQLTIAEARQICDTARLQYNALYR